MSIGSKVSVNDPLASLHVREPSIFGKPVNSVARLPKDVRVLFFHDSLSVFFSRQEGLALEELKVLENLAAEPVINAVVHKVVSTVIQLLGKVDLHDDRHSFLGNKSARLPNYFDFVVVAWEVFFQHLIDLGSYVVEVFFLDLC